jgi:L-histidine N-alpha-methyltransferase
MPTASRPWAAPTETTRRASITEPGQTSPRGPERAPPASIPDPEFALNVLEGLSGEHKRLSSRYFYDDRGDRLFQAIMSSPEYYLTDCEFEILGGQGAAIADELLTGGPCEFVELGSGDGQKVGLLLDALHAQSADWAYRPVDISEHSLGLLKSNILPGRPWLQLDPIHGNYHDVLESLTPGETRRVFLFLGSNLGNFGVGGAQEFLRLVRSAMADDDALLIGLDLKKDPEVVLAAYDDAEGYTRDFNLNLLTRINRELDGDFDLEGFDHRPEYDPESGAARSYLVSRRRQRVHIEMLDESFQFEPGERIFMEISQKYDKEMIRRICEASGFVPDAAFFDRRGWFTDQVWRPERHGRREEGECQEAAFAGGPKGR